MKRLLLTAKVLICVFAAHAQTEIFFSTDTVKIKSLQGVSLTTDEKWLLGKSSSFNSLLEASYFYELRLTDYVSLTLHAGLNTTYMKSGHIVMPMFNQFDILMGAAPRYYFNLNERVSEHRGGLNSGWFLSMPLQASTALRNSKIVKMNGVATPIPEYPFKFGEFINYSAGLNIGYRYALTNHIFLEGIGGGGYQTYNFKTGNFFLNGTLKVAYTF